ncbi:MAG: hypothetical protein ACKPFF_37715, partial [Planktothrix sp.]
NQQDLRRSAAEKFIESFDQELLSAFQESEEVTSPPQTPPTEKPVSPPPALKDAQGISLLDLEDAISDIEQYLQQRHSKK